MRGSIREPGLSEEAAMIPIPGQIPETPELTGTGSMVATEAIAPEVLPTIDEARRLRIPPFMLLLIHNKKSLFGLCVLGAIILMAILAPWLERADPNAMNFSAIGSPPSWQHPFGTTQQGNDIFSQVVWGARTSLLIGASAAALATLLSATVGMVAAYVGGIFDELLNLITNVFLVLPGLPLLIVVSSYLPFRGGIVMVILIASLTWAGEARVLRSFALTLRSRDFVLAARTSGESTTRIVFGEIMPNMTSRIAAGFLGAFVGAILFEAGLEFLGFGGANGVSWGVTLFWAQNNAALETGAWWHFVFPGMALALTATSLIFINYGIDEISNPRLQRIKMPKLPKRRAVASARDSSAQPVATRGRA
jgi:peptide/nickel transport system permease protein